MVVTDSLILLLLGSVITGHVTDCEGSSVTIIVGDNTRVCNEDWYNEYCFTGYFMGLSYFKYKKCSLFNKN